MDDAHSRAMLELCERFFAAAAAGDVEAVRGIYAPDAVIWHNNDGREQTVEQNLGVLAWATSRIEGFRYEDVRRTVTDSGFIEQHVLRGRAPNGVELRVPACLVCTVVDGRIARVDEYFDSAQIAALTA
jgi:ketosteroid isomerase-like protein